MCDRKSALSGNSVQDPPQVPMQKQQPSSVLKTQYQFINFVKIPSTGITSKWSCANNRSGDELGEIKWYGAWRQYCYFPTVCAVYSRGCLQDINDFIGQLRG